MTMYLVRRGTSTFYRDIEKDGDADLDNVYGEQEPINSHLVDDEGNETIVRFVQLTSDRKWGDKPMHNFVPTGESIDFDTHTITREQYLSR
jgi:hypothetical protein